MGKLESRAIKKDSRKPKRTLDASKKEKGSWEKKQKERERLKRIRALSKRLRDEINQEQANANAARKANRERKAENERKNMVVQKISNIKAIKKLSPKHRKAARIFLQHELK